VRRWESEWRTGVWRRKVEGAWEMQQVSVGGKAVRERGKWVISEGGG
jgi:hypothetical protein